MPARALCFVLLLLFCVPATAEDNFAALAKSAGEPKIPGLNIVYLSALGNPAEAPWKNILLHQTETPPGTMRTLADKQAGEPMRRGVILWVETDGTILWSVPETTVTTQGDGANRNDNKYIDNSKTYRQVTQVNTIGIEFGGNAPDVRKPPTPKQFEVCLILVRFIQERYGIPAERIYAHNWIDLKDARYCEGCELAKRARAQNYVPTELRSASGVEGAAPATGR